MGAVVTDAPLAVVQPTRQTKGHRLDAALTAFSKRVIAIALQRPDYTLPQCAYLALQGDPTLCAIIEDGLQRGSRGPTPGVDDSRATLFYVARRFDTSRDVSQVRLVAPSPAPLAPSEVPPSQTLPPPTSPTPSIPTPTEGTSARPRNEHWDALTAALGEAKTPSARNVRGKAVKDFKEAGYTPEQIVQAAANWRAKMGDVLMTDTSLVKYIGQCLGGPRLGKHVQSLYENGSIRHQRGLQ